MGLWDDEMKLEIIAHKGSVQAIERIPLEIRNLYKTVWELSQKVSLYDIHFRKVNFRIYFFYGYLYPRFFDRVSI